MYDAAAICDDIAFVVDDAALVERDVALVMDDARMVLGQVVLIRPHACAVDSWHREFCGLVRSSANGSC